MDVMRMASEDTARRLAGELEALSEESISLLRAIVGLSVDTENGALLRAQVAAAAAGLNVQLRADALRLQAVRADRALERLVEILGHQEKKVPSVSMASLAHDDADDTHQLN